MPYIGSQGVAIQGQNTSEDTFTATAGQTVFTLTSDVTVATDILVAVNGISKYTTSYTLSGVGHRTLTFGAGLSNGDLLRVLHIGYKPLGQINTGPPADGTVTNAKMANDAVGVQELNATGSATDSTFLRGDNTWGKPDDASDLTTGTLPAARIASNAITTAKIADGSITAAKIADGTIVATEVASNAITTVKILDANVTTAKVADANITTAKLAADAVDGTKVADNAIATEHITNANVTTAKLAADAVDGTKIADNAVAAEHISNNAITTDKIADNAITSDKVAGLNGGTF